MKTSNFSNRSWYVMALGTLLVFSACKKTNVSEPQASAAATSGEDLIAAANKVDIYVSAADTAAAVNNLYLYGAASHDILQENTYNTGAKDGNGVYYNVATDELYQLSRKNKTLYVFANASAMSSTPIPARTFTDSTLTSGREIAYDRKRDILYIANNTDSSIRIYKRFSNQSGNVTGRTVKIQGQPWGISFDDKQNRLIVVMDLAAMRLDIFDNPNKLEAGSATASRSINIADRPNGTFSRLHGVTYNSDIDALFVTEIGEAVAPAIPTPGKPAFNADGGIYILKNAGAKLAAGGTINADAIIYGANTTLGNPVDVSSRVIGGNAYIFIAEKANKKILLFKFTDAGDVAPSSTGVVTFAPEAITLSK
ncbi:MAG: hypothetical protein ABI921_11900 [Panacibacter sp.]